MSINKHKLSNLTLLIDYNKIQSYGFTKDVLELEPLNSKLSAFGYSVKEINGHDVNQLQETFNALPFDGNKSSAIICHTIKGKGFSFAENNPNWHHKSNLKEDELKLLNESIK